MREVQVRTGSGRFGQKVTIGPHELVGDESRDAGGDDSGPSPHELLLAALGTCTSMTVAVYAARKAWPLAGVEVNVTGQPEEGEYRITRTLRLAGGLDDAQRARLLEIAERCPVAKTLRGPIRISTALL
jgi:putative redox protein